MTPRRPPLRMCVCVCGGEGSGFVTRIKLLLFPPREANGIDAAASPSIRKRKRHTSWNTFCFSNRERRRRRRRRRRRTEKKSNNKRADEKNPTASSSTWRYVASEILPPLGQTCLWNKQVAQTLPNCKYILSIQIEEGPLWGGAEAGGRNCAWFDVSIDKSVVEERERENGLRRRRWAWGLDRGRFFFRNEQFA